MGVSGGKDANGQGFNTHGFFTDPKWPTPGLLAYYPFEGNAQDLSGHGYGGQVFGATLTRGYRGQAYAFNGQNNYIKAKLDISPSQQWNVTLGAWVKAATTADGIFLGNKVGGGGRALGLMGGKWSAFSHQDAGGWLQGDPVVPGTWVFLAASYDQTAKTLKFYVNDKVYTSTGDNLALDDGDPYLGIGAIFNTNTPEFFFNGAIDNVFVYNVVLSDAQIAAIRANGVINNYSTLPPPASVSPRPALRILTGP